MAPAATIFAAAGLYQIVLVAAGSMGLGWAVAIAVIVFVEKIAPHGDVLARVTGVRLLALALTEGVWGWPGI